MEELILPGNYITEQKNVFFLKRTGYGISRWTIYQALFSLWLIWVKVSRRKFASELKLFKLALQQLEVKGAVIDIGGGSGWMSNYLTGFDRFVVLDPLYRKTFLKTKAYRDGKGYYIQGKAEKIPFTNNSFDLALMCSTIDHVSNPQKALEEVARVLKPNGQLLLSHKIIQHSSYKLGHPKIITLSSLRKLVSKYFTIDKELISPDKKVIYMYLKNIGV